MMGSLLISSALGNCPSSLFDLASIPQNETDPQIWSLSTVSSSTLANLGDMRVAEV
jgi:hypothetical protein